MDPTWGAASARWFYHCQRHRASRHQFRRGVPFCQLNPAAISAGWWWIHLTHRRHAALRGVQRADVTGWTTTGLSASRRLASGQLGLVLVPANTDGLSRVLSATIAGRTLVVSQAAPAMRRFSAAAALARRGRRLEVPSA